MKTNNGAPRQPQQKSSPRLHARLDFSGAPSFAQQRVGYSAPGFDYNCASDFPGSLDLPSATHHGLGSPVLRRLGSAFHTIVEEPCV